jgi:malate synthase
VNVRILNAITAASTYLAPGRPAISNASAGFQDVAHYDAVRLAVRDKDDPAANDAAMAKVTVDKDREGGTWVAHPGLMPIAKEIVDRLIPGPNQSARKRQDVCVTATHF